jgi:hypothetical protein
MSRALSEVSLRSRSGRASLVDEVPSLYMVTSAPSAPGIAHREFSDPSQQRLQRVASRNQRRQPEKRSLQIILVTKELPL